jgi:serine/threonine protein kinase
MGEAKVIGRICSGCGAEATPAAKGDACPRCGHRLIEVRAARDELIGKVIDDRWEVKVLLGRGGMGSVYSCYQKDIRKEVALKLIDARIAQDAMGVRRFLREAKLTQKLVCDQVVQVLDFGQTRDGRLFIAMELLQGRTLAEVIDREAPLPLSRAARITLQFCEALEAAHGLGILHRDLKPSNAMLLAHDRLKILDFGLAKSLRDDESRTTGVGLVMGTPGYIAPELLKGQPATVASDLYAVGVILGEMVTGRHVWGVQETKEMQQLQQRGMPAQLKAPLQVRPLLDRLLSPLPSRRPQSAAQLRPLLLPLLESRGPHTPSISLPPTPPPEETQGVGLFGMLAFAALLGVGAMVWKRQHSQPPPQQIVIEQPQVTPSVVAVAPQPQPQVVPPPPPPPVQQAALAPAAPSTVTIHIQSDPSGAAVLLDGKESGTTPFDAQVKPGVLLAVEMHLGDRVAKESVTPVGGETLKFRFAPVESAAKDVARPKPRLQQAAYPLPPGVDPSELPPGWRPGDPIPGRPPPPPR